MEDQNKVTANSERPMLIASNFRPQMNFPAAIKEIINGKKITKLEWKDNNIYGELKEGKLKIHLADGLYHDWILTDGDLLGEDYVVI